MGERPLAHSAPRPGAEPQSYADHVTGVVKGARSRAEAMGHFCCDPSRLAALPDAVVDAATFHDLGKLDPDIQAALRQGRTARLCWDHVDAGVAHLWAHGAKTAAWLVRAHHAPGLPSKPAHFTRTNDPHLRGRRHDASHQNHHQEQIERTDSLLATMLRSHEREIGPHSPRRGKVQHGLALRLALSCLVDADHADTARSDTGWSLPTAPEPRWAERLESLDRYVDKLDGAGQRNILRRQFYDACRKRAPDASLMACEGPVGIGKTTAVTAYLLRRAIETGARRLFIVAPFTAILSQTAERLREALLLDDERGRAETVIAEHHHRADFSDISSRDLAVLWSAPIIVTTAVQFFETLAAAQPSALRKLHMLPGSAVFLDEAHAALPVSGSRTMPSTGESVNTPILPQNWRWICELTSDWSCSFVLASGSLARFWEIEDIVGDARRTLPDLVPRDLVQPLLSSEAARVRYAKPECFAGPEPLMEAVTAKTTPSPRLLIMNTVQSAAVMARDMREAGHDVLHLSNALCPRDRAVVLEEVKRRLNPDQPYPEKWTLVATSVMEAGVDVSFRTCFRERFATTSLIQIGGRGNRDSKEPDGAAIHDFIVDAMGGLTRHPDARVSADVLLDLLREGAFDGQVDPASLVTYAMRRELRRRGRLPDYLGEAERFGNYPDVASLGRLIDAQTRLVVVDPLLRDRIARHERVSSRDVLAGSIQIWVNRIEHFRLEALQGREDIYWWPYCYDPRFLGYMAGALELAAIVDGRPTFL